MKMKEEDFIDSIAIGTPPFEGMDTRLDEAVCGQLKAHGLDIGSMLPLADGALPMPLQALGVTFFRVVHAPAQTFHLCLQLATLTDGELELLLPAADFEGIRGAGEELEGLVEWQLGPDMRRWVRLVERSTTLLAALYRLAFWVPANSVTFNVTRMLMNYMETLHDAADDWSDVRACLTELSRCPDAELVMDVGAAAGVQVDRMEGMCRQLDDAIHGLWLSRPYYAGGAETLAVHLLPKMPDRVPDEPPIDFLSRLDVCEDKSQVSLDTPQGAGQNVPQEAPQRPVKTAPAAGQNGKAAGLPPIHEKLVSERALAFWRKLVAAKYCREEADHYHWKVSMRLYGFMVYWASAALDFYHPAHRGRLMWQEFGRLFTFDGSLNTAQTALRKWQTGELNSRQAGQEMMKMKVIFK